jgi:hypothetical protein
MRADIIQPRPARNSHVDLALVVLMNDVIAGHGILAAMKLRAALAKLDVDAARALYLRLADANDPIAMTFARLPERAEWRELLRSARRLGPVNHFRA